MGLITLEEFKLLPLGLNDRLMGKVTDPGLQAFIETASDQVINYCGRVLASASIVEGHRGNDLRRMVLREWPVTELESVVWEDDNAATGSVDVAMFRVSASGLVQWKNPIYGPFLPERYYTFTYTAGYDPVPNPVKHATGLWVTELLQPLFAVPSGKDQSELVALSSEQIGELLEDYRRKGVA